MRHRPLVALQSAPDAGVRVSYYAVSMEAKQLLDDLGIWQDATMTEAASIIERRMKLMNVDQRLKMLERIGRLIRVPR